MRFLALLTYHWINRIDVPAHKTDHVKRQKPVCNIVSICSRELPPPCTAPVITLLYISLTHFHIIYLYHICGLLYMNNHPSIWCICQLFLLPKYKNYSYCINMKTCHRQRRWPGFTLLQKLHAWKASLSNVDHKVWRLKQLFDPAFHFTPLSSSSLDWHLQDIDQCDGLRFGCCPVSRKPYHCVTVIVFFPESVFNFFTQSFKRIIFDHYKNLICR